MQIKLAATIHATKENHVSQTATPPLASVEQAAANRRVYRNHLHHPTTHPMKKEIEAFAAWSRQYPSAHETHLHRRHFPTMALR